MFGKKLHHMKAALRRMLLISLTPIVLASCTTLSARDNRAEPEIFRVGELEVRLYSNRERMMSSLPPFLTLLAATRVGNNQIQISGYYDQENKRIYAINDAKTVIHEFKHYLEPDWKHGAESARTEQQQNSLAATPMGIPATPPATASVSRQPTVEAKSEFYPHRSGRSAPLETSSSAN